MIPASASPLLLAGAAEEAAYTISRSLRFNSGDSAFLSRTPSSAGNRKTWTWSGWVKRSKLGGFQPLFAVSGGDAFRFESSPADALSLNNSGTSVLSTSGVFRDPSAWYHVVLAVDTTQSSNRVKIYVNGELQVQGDPYSLNEDTPFNNTVAHEIGRNPAAATRLFDGYLADVILVDGQALDPTSFGEFDEYNNWQPKEYTGTFGTNGFHLPFSDGSSLVGLGTDTSVTLSAAEANKGMDVVTYTGNGSTQTINSLRFAPDFVWIKSRSNGTLFNFLIDSVRGNTKELYSNGTNAEATNTTTVTAFNSDGFSLGSRLGTNQSGGLYVAWCWKAGGPATSNTDGTITSQVSANQDYGFSIVSYTGTGSAGSFGHGLAAAPGLVIIKKRTGDMTKGYWTVHHSSFSSGGFMELNTTGAFGSDTTKFSSAPSSTVINIGNNSNVNQSGQGLIAYCWSEVSGFSKFGSYTGTGSAGLKITTDFKPRYLLIKRTDAAEDWIVYDTQRDDNTMTSQLLANSSAAEATGGEVVSNSDGFTINATGTDLNTSGGTYIYAVFAAEPGNNWALNNFVADKSASTGFKAVTYTGNGSTLSIGGLGFSPDFLWIKRRNGANSHHLFDAIRGVDKILISNNTNAEATFSGALNSFDSNGFTLGGTSASTNASGGTYVAWCWDAGNSTVSNTDGTITSSVRANTDLGFSIVSYTGNGTQGATIGHGLNAIPAFVIIKNRTDPDAWDIFHKDVGYSKVLRFSTAVAASAGDVYPSSHTSSVIKVGNSVSQNGNNEAMIAYCFAPKAGVSAFGSYVGNGSTSGPMVVTGFKPAFVMVKITDGATSNWQIIDNARSGNPNGILFPNLSNAEDTTSTSAELLSNGFKINNSGNGWNRSGSTYIYMAFAAPGDGAEIDSLLDTITNSGTDTGAGGEVSGNYATLNPLDSNSSLSLQNGNLYASNTVATTRASRGTFAISSGKWYWEVTLESALTGSTAITYGIGTSSSSLSNYVGSDATAYGWYNDGGGGCSKTNNGSFTNYGSIVSSGVVVGVAFDADAGSLTFYRDGTSQGSAFTGITARTYFPMVSLYNVNATTNFGQRPFAYDISTGISQATGAIPILSTSDDYGQTLSSGTASDSNSSSIVLALPMNGTNGGTTFTDYSATIKGSGSAKTITVNGDAQTSTTQSKWYGSSGKFDGSGDRLDIASTADFNLGSSWTIEYWFYTAGTAVTRHYYFHNNANNLQSATSGTQLLFYNGSSSVTFGSLQLNNWHHVAAVNTAGTVSFYIDGVKQSSTIAAGNVSTSLALTIGAFTDGQNAFNGYMQDFRIYNGVAKYTSNFTPPSSALFKALCTANFDEPTVPDGSTAMDVVTYTGNGSTQTISGLNLSPDLVWMKMRSTTGYSHKLVDQVRGATKSLVTNNTNAELTETSGLTAFTSDGFSLGSQDPYNRNNDTFVAWTWDGGSSTVSNTDGSITSSVRANPTAGFSSATFTNVSGTQSVGHGLGVAPHMVIIRYRNIASDWAVYHESLGTGKYINLNSTAAAQSVAIWGSGHTSSVVGLSGFGQNNQPAIMYSFAPVEGYSAFGSFTGNGSTDGPFVYTGFRPRWIMAKQTSGTGGNWFILDTARNTYNVMNNILDANLSDAERNADIWDVLSNGFKIRISFSSGATFIWAAFAEHPFRTSRAR